MLARWRALFRSTVARFFLLFFLAQMGLALSVLFFVQRSSEQALLAEQQAIVLGLRGDLAAAYDQGGRSDLIHIITERLEKNPSAEAVILLTDASRQPLAGNLAAWPAEIPKATDWRITSQTPIGSDDAELMGVATTPLPGGEHLLTGTQMESYERLTLIGREATLGALTLAVPLTLALSLLLGRMITQRIRRIVETARLIGNGHLHQRVPSHHSGDAFDDLGQSVNAMLDRIEALVGELRVVTDGLAHDLRSPITRLRSTLERAIVETEDATAQAALARVAAEADTLLAMLTLAVQISRAEAGIGRDRFVATDVGALLSDLVEIYGPVAEEEGKIVSCDEVQGLNFPLHRELISQALGNLIENALKYAEGARNIHISAVYGDGFLVLAVADDGPGIPEHLRSEARKRFARLDHSRGKPGSGLGLSLVEAVANLHRGKMTLSDNAPGLRVGLSLLQ